MWDDPEERKKKKLRKAAKGAAGALGGGIALWLFLLLYPQNEEAQKVIPLLHDLVPVLILYGAVVLAAIALKRDKALAVNALLTWLLLPSYVAYLFFTNSSP